MRELERFSCWISGRALGEALAGEVPVEWPGDRFPTVLKLVRAATSSAGKMATFACAGPPPKFHGERDILPCDDFRVVVVLPAKPNNGDDTTRRQLGRPNPGMWRQLVIVRGWSCARR
jgi:hypothetical protein